MVGKRAYLIGHPVDGVPMRLHSLKGTWADGVALLEWQDEATPGGWRVRAFHAHLVIALPELATWSDEQLADVDWIPFVTTGWLTRRLDPGAADGGTP